MKDIKNYEGLYAVTSCGRVWSYRNERFLEPLADKKGYLRINLCKNGKAKKFLIHRLVAMAYLPNPDNLPQINHKDECKTNNCLQNLEWCDCKYNINYGTRNDKIKKPILQYSLDGELIREWECTADVGREVHSAICHCLKGRNKTAYGYKWVYKE